MGPYVKRLIIHKMSHDAIPDGGGIADGLKFLSDKTAISNGAKAAKEWVEEAIRAVKSAPNNRFGDDDEAIAGEILRQIEAKKLSNKP